MLPIFDALTHRAGHGAEKVNIDGLTYSGTHGLEWSDGLPWLHSVQVVPDALAYAEAGAYLLGLVEQHLSELPGAIVQCKRIGGSIHYHLSPHPEEVHRAILSLLEEPARRLDMSPSEGKRIVEILAPLPIDKGTALRTFSERFALRASSSRATTAPTWTPRSLQRDCAGRA